MNSSCFCRRASATALLSTSQITPEDHLELLTVINEESDRLDRLIVQALQMGQLESGVLPMHFSPQSLQAMVQHAAETIAPALREHRLIIDIPVHTPKVLADPEWIERTLANLIENAAKYSPPGRSIQVSATVRDNYVFVSVTDQGDGVDPRERELIFERFYRGKHKRRSVPGTGMGLAICRAIIRAHQGEITVQDGPEIGACFTFTLPVASLDG
uniref:histidine kinase n=1 Tax=Acidobacterium capsulatum TaxID=33075 RepID=A0A7V5CSX4_9BACT